jgi:protein transport protein SEC31
MALLKKVDNLGCHVCWSPFKESKSVIAVGSKGSMTSFDDDRGELILYDVSTRYAGTKPVEMGRVKARSKFGSIAWGQCASHSQGLIAGGMSSGHVEIYDPSNLNSPIASIQAHKETVNALAFNPHASRSHILASGSSDGDVKIIDLHNPSNPQMCFPSNAQNDRHRGAVRSVQWNTKVDYIVASSSDDGSCIIWDLKRNKRWATLHAPRGSAFVDFAWHPSEGFQILTALADDSKPVVQVWDLRKSTTTPLGELQGHEKGLLSIDWSPQDPRLVVTSGQDNRTLMWDLQSGKSVYEIPSEEAAKPKVVQDTKQQDDRKSPTGEGNFWENGGVGSSQVASAVIGGKVRRITELSWSPHMPLVMAACTFDVEISLSLSHTHTYKHTY